MSGPKLTTLKLPSVLDLEFLPDEKSPSERFSSSDENKPEQKIRLSDPETGKTWGFVVIDNTVRGPGLGGIRMAPDLTLLEVSRLARAMTLKNSAACLPLGGGKSGLTVDPVYFNSHPEIKKNLISLFADALFRIDGYISAPDMGTNEIDVQQIYERFSEKLGTFNHMRGGAGRPPEKGGIPIDDWGLTAHGLFAAAKTMQTLELGFPIKNARVVIQATPQRAAPVRAVVASLFRAWRYTIGAVIPDSCRFTPTCSRYAEEAVLRRGLIVGIALTLWRLLRCHPFSQGGYDPVVRSKPPCLPVAD